MAVVILLHTKCLPLFYTPNYEPEPVFVNVMEPRESIPMDGPIPGPDPPAYVAWRDVRQRNRVVVQARHAGNRRLCR
jgi:hypothetical protein